MKKIDLYQCETCHTNYSDKYAAKQCEEAHKRIKIIDDSTYLPYKNLEGGYPSRVKLRFEDGSERWYKLA